jgi:cytochrome b
MSIASASRAEAGDGRCMPPAPTGKVLVWDAPVRVFHWLMVLSFAGAWLTAESERLRLVHVSLGYTMAGLVLFRLVWGLIGTRHARFASFVRGPAAILRYLRSLLGRQPEHHTGHNPAGALAIVALLVLTLLLTASGWANYNELGGHYVEELHEALANGMLLLAGIHVAAVVLSSWLHRENLVHAMVSGRKHAPSQQGIRNARYSVAILMLAAVLYFWWSQWQGAPSPADSIAPAALAKGQGKHHDDD